MFLPFTLTTLPLEVKIVLHFSVCQFAVDEVAEVVVVIGSWWDYGRSGSSGSVGGFRRLRLSNRGLALKARRNLDRCRYRYICRPGGFPARGGCRPKRSGFGFRDRSRSNHARMTFQKLLCLSDGLAGVLCLNPTYGYYMIQFYLASRLY